MVYIPDAFEAGSECFDFREAVKLGIEGHTSQVSAQAQAFCRAATAIEDERPAWGRTADRSGGPLVGMPQKGVSRCGRE